MNGSRTGYRLAMAFLSLMTALAAQVAQPLDPYQPPVNSTKTIRLWGNRHMDGLARAWASAYGAMHPEISFNICLLGNGTAMPALYLGRADLVFFGRDPIVTDRDAFNHVMKYDPLRIELATGSLGTPGKSPALALFVHRDNPLSRLTLAQVDAIFSHLRRRGAPAPILTWDQLGLTGEWAGQPIRIYADDTQSMAALFFQRVALENSRMMNWDHFTEFRDLRDADGRTTEAAAQSMAALSRDRFGLAVAHLGYLGPQVKPLALAREAGDEYCLPTVETLVSRRYPLTRTILAFANQPPGQPLDPKVSDFLRFILGPDGQRVLAMDGQYLPLSAEAAQAELGKLR